MGHTSDHFTMKLRDFDALMTGALYITHRNPDLLSIFNEGEDFECYSSTKELIEKIKFYQKFPEKASEIGLRGREKALKYHSWDYRLKEYFTRLGIIRK